MIQIRILLYAQSQSSRPLDFISALIGLSQGFEVRLRLSWQCLEPFTGFAKNRQALAFELELKYSLLQVHREQTFPPHHSLC